MEISATRSKNKFLKFLPRAASAITFHGPPFSPKDNKRPDNNGLKPKSHFGTKGGFSGPIISLVPAEARRRKQPKNSSFEAHEPTSPKVSCMGQIKLKKKQKKIIKKEKHSSLPRDFKPVNSVPAPVHQRDQEEKKKKRHPLALGKLFRGARPPHGRKPEENKPKVDDRAAPGLGQIRRFASGRDHSLANFDWTAQIAPVDGDDDGDYYSDEEERGGEREVIIPFSAPILLGGGGGGGGVVALEPKKEINLWKRRTMAQPRPLQVN